ncbi:hypothetical protein [Palleronia caenipelagi]|uniref:Uncharacterized protein n=1 Tax=Palleronia caenipelagi TaxID=2489174 RepID=A0A547Q6V6_9RHOB|nr:hypothetical protein [Palleronia caenipelagi]TRD22091.1 hypothetical protein FEV53_06930 [Palleronia caenipelagi]
MSMTRRTALTALAAAPVGCAPAATGDDTPRVEAVQGRLDYFAKLTDTAPPSLTIVDGDIQISTDILRFCAEEGINLDWLFLGDVRAFVLSYREQRLNAFWMQKKLKTMDREARSRLRDALKATVHHGIPLDVALSDAAVTF